MDCKVSIIMLTHNATDYVGRSIRSLRKYTKYVPYELIVLDNASELSTRNLLKRLTDEKLIDRMIFLDYNSLFAGGNNIAARSAAEDSTHLLLLNSDVEIRHPAWLRRLLDVHKPGVTSYGVCTDIPLRVDGYCFLIDTPLYRKHQLDEQHQWSWAITRLQADLLRAGYSVQGYVSHKRFIHHFGGKSGADFRAAKGMDVHREEALGWFANKSITVLDRRTDGTLPGHKRSIFRKLLRKTLPKTSR